MRLRVILFTVVATAFVALATWATEPYNTSGRWACFAGTCIVGHAQAPAIQLLTDSTGNDEIVVPNDSIGTAELTRPLQTYFNICGEATTVNNNSVYYGAASDAAGGPIILSTTNNGQSCSIDAAGSTTVADEDEYVFTGIAFGVLGMVCRNEADANADISFTLLDDTAVTTPSVTCTIADNARDCVANVQTTTDIASGSKISLKVSSTGNIGDNNGFVCQVFVAF